MNLEQISQSANIIRSGAQELSKRIESFEAYLGTLTGKTRCQVQLENGEILSFTRKSQNWLLLIERSETDIISLHSDAPLKTKMMAVKAFPKLLEAMLDSQQEMIRAVDSTIVEFDKFFKGLGI